MKVSSKNHFYWEYKEKPVLLLGGSDEDNLFNHPNLMHDNLDKLRECGGNYIRCTLSSRDEGNVWPFEKVNGLYDLNQFNPEFWERLNQCLNEAYKRDIIVQVEVWATFDFYRDCWLKNPFNPAQNCNYSVKSTKLKTEWNYHPARRPQPFFYSPPELNDDRVLRGFQEAFVQKVLDVSLRYPNVLYCLDNETNAPEEWVYYWANFIQDEAKKRGALVQLTEMWDNWNLRDQSHKATYGHPELFSFVEISQNNMQCGQTHYDRIIWMRDLLKERGIRPMNNVKVYAKTSEELRNGISISWKKKIEITRNRFWQNMFAGCTSTRFHRPEKDYGIGLNREAQITIKAARTFTSAFGIFSCEPHNELLSEHKPNEAYCLANPGDTYAVYFPNGGDIGLHIKEKDPCLYLQWFDPLTASFKNPKQIKESLYITLHSPNNRQTWLALLK